MPKRRDVVPEQLADKLLPKVATAGNFRADSKQRAER